MKLEQSFEVAAPLERVWNALIDVEHVAPCLPGASVTGRNDDGSYNGTITIKIGPTTANYAGKLEMQQVDEATRSATMHANGTDKRGQGGATATITSTLREQGGVTRVDVSTDYHITGRLARFGRGGMIEDVSKRLLREFAKRLQDSLVHEDAPAEQAPAPGAVESAIEESATNGGAPTGTPSAEAAGSAEAAAAGAEAPGAGGAGAGSGAATGGSGAGAGGGAAAPQPPPTAAPRPQHHHAPAEPIQAVELAAGVVLDRIRRNPLRLVVGLLVAVILLARKRRGE